MAIQKYSEERPWGKFEQFTHGEPSTVKILTVNPGEELSLQYHAHREEFWRVLKGHPVITIGDTHTTAQEGDEFFVARTEKHRIKADADHVSILEISFGAFDEKDIVRLEDKYHRS